MNPLHSLIVSAALGLVLFSGCATRPDEIAAQTLKRSLIFHANFDGTTDAGVAGGDKRLQVGPQWGKPRTISPGLPPGNTVHLAPGEGLFGDGLRFEKRIKELVCYAGEGNIHYNKQDWSGTVSYWVKVDPEKDLEHGYCDTLQITSKDWNDASFFTDFTQDDKPRHFRLGAMADLSVWNPNNRDWDRIPEHERPLATVKKTPFSSTHWTHVVFTWEHFNTGRPDGVAHFYLDGVLQGQVGPKTQTFTWDMKETRIMLGLSYAGLMDDLAIFNRSLTAQEVGALNRLPKGVSGLKP
jgi:hypothetical protein